jgi:hypothetical protein
MSSVINDAWDEYAKKFQVYNLSKDQQFDIRLAFIAGWQAGNQECTQKMERLLERLQNNQNWK